jgi:hypothetical protein
MTAPVMQAPEKGETIAMTAPVMQTAADAAWIVRFVMPQTYTLQTLPVPNDARVKVLEVPATQYAVVRFSGLAGESDIADNTAALRAFMQTHQLQAAGEPTLARYNPPWTLWFLRRNEVMVPLQASP